METTIRAKINHHFLNTGVANGKPWKRLTLYLLKEVFHYNVAMYVGAGNFVCWNELAEQFSPFSKDQLFELTFRKVQRTVQGKPIEVNEIIACKKVQAA